MSPITQLLVVFRKEVKDAFRDRRAIMTIVLSATISPLLLGFMMNRIADRQRQLDDITIPIVGMEHAPAFIEWLQQQAGVTLVEGPADAEVAVRDRNEDVILVIPDDFQEKFRKSSPAPIKKLTSSTAVTSVYSAVTSVLMAPRNPGKRLCCRNRLETARASIRTVMLRTANVRRGTLADSRGSRLRQLRVAKSSGLLAARRMGEGSCGTGSWQSSSSWWSASGRPSTSSGRCREPRAT